MQNWQKNRNYRKYENEDGSFRYVIAVDGEDVEVNEEIYKAYSQADRKERYAEEREEGLLLSLEKMSEDGIPLSYFTERHIESAEDMAIQIVLAEQAAAAYKMLNEEEQRLIQAVVIGNVSERDYAERIGLSQKGVNKRKQKILEKLKKLVLKP